LKKLFVKKRFHKEDKQKSILFGLIEQYIKTNAPIGSNSLREYGFEHMSSATIRNYFAELERKGLVTQQHASGGRIPTAKAFKLYAEFCLETCQLDKKDEKFLQKELDTKTKKITDYLNTSCEFLSQLTNLSVFISSPKFDQDIVSNLKLIGLEKNKLLCVIVTDFGIIKTEILYSNHDLDHNLISLIEDFFLWRMNKKPKPKIEDQTIFKLAQHLYNEIMVRYIVGYANCNIEDIYKTGLSNLLSYPEFKDPAVLSEGLSIFENIDQMRLIMQDAIKQNSLIYLIADDFEKFNIKAENIAIICIPYYFANIPVGSIGILCPIRTPYKKIFAILKAYSQNLSDNLTKTLYKYKITFKKPSDLKKVSEKSILLEDKSR
jgi:heat-inducible transcriptional repressor